MAGYPGRMNTMHVLFVDDETEFLELVSKRLARRGIEVTTASSGEAGLEAARTARFDVVVLDVKMPGMDGLETLRHLRKLTPTTPVLLLTGHASLGAALNGMEAGAFDYMLKPVAINELIMKLTEAARLGSS